MMQKLKLQIKGTKLVVSIILFVLCVALFAVSISGYIIRSTQRSADLLDKMSISAVLNTATNGLVEKIATTAKADKLKALRKMPDFRQMGTAAVTRLCEEAAEEARAEARLLYSGNDEGFDTTVLESNIAVLRAALKVYDNSREEDKTEYTKLYNAFVSNVASFTAFVEGKDNDAIWSEICTVVPELQSLERYKKSFVDLANDKAEQERIAKEREAAAALEAETDGETADETLTQSTEASQAVDMKYLVDSEKTEANLAAFDEAFKGVWAELVNMTPNLKTLDKATISSIEQMVMEVVAAADTDFANRYSVYASHQAEESLKGGDKLYMKVAAVAETVLIAAIAIMLFAILYAYWKQLTTSMGVPRTIILLFFIYLLLAARFYGMNINAMLGNVLTRVGMYGILVLAMLPSIQCGIGLNMGMTIGCVSGLFAVIVTLQYNMTGYFALFFACILGALVALPLGWAYSLLLNRMKGSEMTISTYVGYSFVSLMCIGWLMLPFYNPKIVFPLRGSGMRVTHSLLADYAHLLDDFLAFEVFGITVPTGILLFLMFFCVAMWLFTRSKTGIAMCAVGSNPRFAEASGININRMRSLGTVLSMMIAAIGIVVYSSAFGYAQLYNAPKQLGFITASAILIGGASVKKAKVSHVIIGVILFEGVLTLGQQVANAAVSGGGLSEVMRIMISNGIILYALTQSGGDSRG